MLKRSCNPFALNLAPESPFPKRKLRSYSPLLCKGQSVHHICVTQTASIMFSEKNIYNDLDADLFEARNLDHPKKYAFVLGRITTIPSSWIMPAVSACISGCSALSFPASRGADCRARFRRRQTGSKVLLITHLISCFFQLKKSVSSRT